jgi:hypothetical protein
MTQPLNSLKSFNKKKSVFPQLQNELVSNLVPMWHGDLIQNDIFPQRLILITECQMLRILSLFIFLGIHYIWTYLRLIHLTQRKMYFRNFKMN